MTPMLNTSFPEELWDLEQAWKLQKRWERAVRTKTPEELAEAFAHHVGQFYCRPEFDVLAWRVSRLYAADNVAATLRFRARLDDRLYDRYRARVAWEVVAHWGNPPRLRPRS